MYKEYKLFKLNALAVIVISGYVTIVNRYWMNIVQEEMIQINVLETTNKTDI